MEPETQKIYPKLKKIEKEIQILKILILQSIQVPKQKTSLKGTLKGIKINEEEIEEAKKSLFKFSA